MSNSKAWKGDLLGGIISAILGLPKAIPWGVLVFAPLGPAYAAMGAFAGLVSIIFSNLGSAATRGAPILNSGPFSIPTLLLASAVPLILAQPGLDPKAPTTLALVASLIFLTVFMSGIFQAAFGLLKIGSLAKFIPYPVIAGLMNGAGVTILFAQLRPMLGLGKSVALSDLGAVLHHLSLPNLAIGILTVLLFWRGQRLTRRIPPAFLGLIVGTALYHGVKALGYGQGMGPTIGSIPGGIPTPGPLLEFLGVAIQRERLGLVLDLLPIALSIAIVNSLRSLIVVVAVDNVTFERTDSNRELIGQGLGNMLCGAFGGISAAGSQSTTIAGFGNGATTAATKIFSAGASLLVLALLTPLVSLLPEVVLSASLLMMGLEALDSWSIKLTADAVARRTSAPEYTIIFMVVSVAGISIFGGTTQALAAGILLSVAHFIFRMGKDILARQYDLTKIRSHIIRPAAEIKVLEEQGDRVRVLELQGALFFGTADKLATIIDGLLAADTSKRLEVVILNFRKITEMDGSGGNLIGQIQNRCKRKGIQVCISAAGAPGLEQHLKALGAHKLVDGADFFATHNAALARAEDRLLDEALGAERNQREKRPDEISIFSVFTKAEFDVLAQAMQRVCFEPGSSVCRQGEPGDRFYGILRGRAKIQFAAPGTGNEVTVAILCPGMIFGEMAMIDGSPRSASLVADGDLVCVSLNQASIEALEHEHPEIVRKLLQGFALNLAQQLRIANRINSELQA